MEKVGRYTNKSCYKNRRIELRSKNQTEAERRLWLKLRKEQLGVKFRRQYNIDYYIVDFYCHELKLIIELDGYIHGEEENRKKDLIRQKYLESKGYKVLRYQNDQIRYEAYNVLTNIYYIIRQLQTNQTTPSNSP